MANERMKDSMDEALGEMKNTDSYMPSSFITSDVKSMVNALIKSAEISINYEKHERKYIGKTVEEK